MQTMGKIDLHESVAVHQNIPHQCSEHSDSLSNNLTKHWSMLRKTLRVSAQSSHFNDTDFFITSSVLFANSAFTSANGRVWQICTHEFGFGRGQSIVLSSQRVCSSATDRQKDFNFSAQFTSSSSLPGNWAFRIHLCELFEWRSLTVFLLVSFTV